MFERMTERARQVVVLAQDEARALKHNYIGTEHLLLGMLREEHGLAARTLTGFGLELGDVRNQVARIVGRGDEVTAGQIPFTPRSKKVLELSLREALSLGHRYIGTEHILLGLVRENEGVAVRIMLDYDLDAQKIRDEIIRKLSGPSRLSTEDRAAHAKDAKVMEAIVPLTNAARKILPYLKLSTEMRGSLGEMLQGEIKAVTMAEKPAAELRHLAHEIDKQDSAIKNFRRVLEQYGIYSSE